MQGMIIAIRLNNIVGAAVISITIEVEDSKEVHQMDHEEEIIQCGMLHHPITMADNLIQEDLLMQTMEVLGLEEEENTEDVVNIEEEASIEAEENTEAEVNSEVEVNIEGVVVRQIIKEVVVDITNKTSMACTKTMEHNKIKASRKIFNHKTILLIRNTIQVTNHQIRSHQVQLSFKINNRIKHQMVIL